VQVRGGGIPGGKPQQHRDRVAGLATFEQRQAEQQGQHGLASAGLAEHDQPAVRQRQVVVGDLREVAA
jgi:hypothetical protein